MYETYEARFPFESDFLNGDEPKAQVERLQLGEDAPCRFHTTPEGLKRFAQRRLCIWLCHLLELWPALRGELCADEHFVFSAETPDAMDEAFTARIQIRDLLNEAGPFSRMKIHLKLDTCWPLKRIKRVPNALSPKYDWVRGNDRRTVPRASTTSIIH